MPVLSLKDNPPSRFPQQPIIESQKIWWVAKVKPRQEKALATDLFERDIEYFLPYYTKYSNRSDSSSLRKSLLPLFPSYLPFACEKEPWTILSLNRTVNIIPVHAQNRFKKELNFIYMAYDQKLNMLPLNQDILKAGQLVKVISGPLCNVVGEIVKLKNDNYILLSVDGLGKACVSVEMNNVTVISG
jgi:hypothetical protein